jgi:hypothetical protein
MFGLYGGPDPQEFSFILRFCSPLMLNYCFKVPYSQSVLRIRRNRMFLGLPDPLVRGLNPRIRIRNTALVKSVVLSDVRNTHIPLGKLEGFSLSFEVLAKVPKLFRSFDLKLL